MKRTVWMLAAGGMLCLAGSVGCGSEQDKMERGVVVDREVNEPESTHELDMTQKERQAADQAQEEKKENKEFDASDQ